MLKLAFLFGTFWLVAVSFYGCEEAVTPTEPTSEQSPTFKTMAGAEYHFVAKWGTQGSGDGQFNSLRGVAVDKRGNVYVADGHNYRIQKFTSDGTFLTKWGSYGSGDGQFDRPSGVAVDKRGNVYVVDGHNYRIQVFAP